MSITGFSITKRIAFRDSLQEFTNVYYYRRLGQPNAAEAEARIDEITAFEKTIHSNIVTFLRGRCWSNDGGPAQNNMITQKNLTGTGSVSPITSLDRERAHLFMWPAGVDSRGKPVFLRKWYHAGGGVAGVGISAAVMEGTTGFTQAQRDTMATAVNAIRVIGLGEYQLAAASGRDSTGPCVAHRYLEHHQLGDMWRAQ